MHLSKRPLACKPQEETTLLSLKKRKLEIEEHRILIEHQAKAIELFAKHCPQNHGELEEMVKSFSKNAFRSIQFNPVQ